MYKMKHKTVSLLLMLLCESILSNPVSNTNSLVVSSTESTKAVDNSVDHDVSYVNPKIHSMEIQTNITNRFATTLISSRVRNLEKKAAETTFSVILPENAFISEFVMEIDGKSYKAYVKEKEEAKKIYEQAVAAGQSAAHVELSARDSKTFTVSVNIEPESKTIFRLTYEELLQRQIGQYELVVNINPGQVVDDLSVNVHINESRPLTFVRTPSLRTGNEISKNDENLDPSADIQVINSTSAIVKFNPDSKQQKHFANLLGTNKESGLAGQFVVQYDVERDPQGGEVLVRDGYFVHFFAPSDLEALPKHIVFVLDHSGSMLGRKIEQLTEAMKNILSELNANDLFNIVRFSDEASVWNVTENTFSKVHLNSKNYGNLEPQLRELGLPEGVKATKENVEKAKNVIQDYSDMGMTNIIVGLETGLFLLKRTQEKFSDTYQPMIVFLTDGLPNVGLHSGDEITETVTRLNSGSNRASVFSLSFGGGADKKFLRKLSSKNLGFSRHIFEAADASLQLQDFYKKISSPLLSNVTFTYVDGVTDVTKSHYPILFNGSELIVAGKTNDIPDFSLDVYGKCKTGFVKFTPVREEPVSSLERLWAYLTVKQILKERETATNKTELTKKALDLALKYSFVTSVTSLVVVKPNQTESVDSTRPKRPPWSTLPTPYNSRSGHAKNFLSSRPSSGIYSPRRTSFSMPHLYRGPPGFSGAPVRHYSFSDLYRGPPGFSGAPVRQYSLSRGPSRYPGTIPTSQLNTVSGPPRFFTTTVVPLKAVPQWLEDIKNNNESIVLPQGSFKLGKTGDVTTHPDCPKTPQNNAGECRLLFDCRQVLPLLTNITVYTQYFCPLNEYAGVCCPKTAY